MHGSWRIVEILTGCFFALCVADTLLELCLIHLLRLRHRQFWTAVGSPTASPWRFVFNSFSGRRYVMSRADRDCHDGLLSAYCRVYRAFSTAFIAFLGLSAVGFAAVAIPSIWAFFHR